MTANASNGLSPYSDQIKSDAIALMDGGMSSYHVCKYMSANRKKWGLKEDDNTPAEATLKAWYIKHKRGTSKAEKPALANSVPPQRYITAQMRFVSANHAQVKALDKQDSWQDLNVFCYVNNCVVVPPLMQPDALRNPSLVIGLFERINPA